MGRKLYAFLNKAYIPFNRLLLKQASGVIVLSGEMLEEIKAMGGRGEKDIVIIPNGVDLELFKPPTRRNFFSSEMKILYVGRLDARKDLPTLFCAVKKLASHLKVKLLIVGEGREKRRLVNLSNRLDLPVKFLGEMPYYDLPEIYRMADIFVLPSLYEPFGMVALEAMACGTPTIVSDAVPIDGIPKFKRGSVKELLELLKRIISSDKESQRLSQIGIEIAQKYSWDKIIFQIVEFFKKFV